MIEGFSTDYNKDVLVPWVAQRLDMKGDDFGDCTAIGRLYDGVPVACVVYHDYRVVKHGASIQASVVCDVPVPRGLVCEWFRYPFVQLGVTRLWAETSTANEKAQKFLERLGFEKEGRARNLWDGRTDSYIYAMVPEDCKFINIKKETIDG